MNQLAKVGKLNRFLHQPTGQLSHLGAEFRKGSSPRPPLGTINVILARPGNDGTSSIGVMSIGGNCDKEAGDQAPKRARVTVTFHLRILRGG